MHYGSMDIYRCLGPDASVYELSLFPFPGLHETLALLTSQLHPDANHKDNLTFLKDVLSEKSLAYLMKVWPIYDLRSFNI